MVGVSIHAPAWGATYLVYEFGICHEFQSTRPRGARLRCRAMLDEVQYVSIHAPAWGATGWQRDGIENKPFQSTRPRGARRNALTTCP